MNVHHLRANEGAFCAVRHDGRAICWGGGIGGEELEGVVEVYACEGMGHPASSRLFSTELLVNRRLHRDLQQVSEVRPFLKTAAVVFSACFQWYLIESLEDHSVELFGSIYKCFNKGFCSVLFVTLAHSVSVVHIGS